MSERVGQRITEPIKKNFDYAISNADLLAH